MCITSTKCVCVCVCYSQTEARARSSNTSVNLYRCATRLINGNFLFACIYYFLMLCVYHFFGFSKLFAHLIAHIYSASNFCFVYIFLFLFCKIVLLLFTQCIVYFVQLNKQAIPSYMRAYEQMMSDVEFFFIFAKNIGRTKTAICYMSIKSKIMNLRNQNWRNDTLKSGKRNWWLLVKITF